MHGIEKWLFPGTPVATILRIRPMAIGLLEKYGLDPWDPAYAFIGELCESKGISPDAFFSDMKSLASPGAGTDWKSRPIFELVDFLSREHKEFVDGLLPSISHALTQEYATEGESLRRFRYLVAEWPAFSEALEAHIREEEAFLFPKILHNDFCIRNNLRHPDLSAGSVNVYVALRLLGNEKQQMAIVRRFLNEVRFPKSDPENQGPLEKRLEPLLIELQARLRNHARLESEVLFPMAKAVEKAHMDARIAGITEGKEIGSPSTPEIFSGAGSHDGPFHKFN